MSNFALFTASYFLSIILLLSVLSYVLPSAVYVSNILFCGVLGLAIAYHAFPYVKNIFLDRRVSPHNKAVLITGCGAGFGRQIAKKLDSLGFHVFASCRSLATSDTEALKKSCSDRLYLLQLDITKDESIKNAVQYVTENLNGLELWALINNAGVYKGFHIDFTSTEVFQEVMDVNTIGTVRVTKAFLPLLKKFKGRVITVTSIAGRIPFPNQSAYCMSKYALVCFCECLRQEMRRWGVKVVIIEPEMFKTAMCDSKRLSVEWEKSVAQIGQSIKDSYGSKFLSAATEKISRVANLASDKVYKVIDSIEAAVCLQEPSYVYRPCRNNFVQFSVYLAQNLPAPVFHQIITRRTARKRQLQKCQ